MLNYGFFGEDVTGIKWIFPTSSIAGGVWFTTYKSGGTDAEGNACLHGHFNECSYDLSEVDQTGREIAAIIQNEVDNGITATNIFISGYSQGG